MGSVSNSELQIGTRSARISRNSSTKCSSRNTSPRQKHGILICLPKSHDSCIPDDYRPISLLNTEYKRLPRTPARRLRPILADQLSKSQYCGVPDNKILDAVAGIRDVLAHYKDKGVALCILTLDFQGAFDRIFRRYLFTILRQCRISNWFAERIQALYQQALASLQINGCIAGPIEIRSGIRQACPLSMILFFLCLHPFLLSLEKTLPGIKVGRYLHSP